MRAAAAILVAAMMVLPLRAEPIHTEPLTVFAAASLKNAFDAIGEVFTQETGIEVVFSYAGTSVLARQVEHGAPANLFASAHEDWMKHLSAEGLVDSDAIVPFASNRLVLIASQGRMFDAAPDLSSVDDVLAILGPDGRLAVAQVDAVPAGVYAREALQTFGVWEALEPRLAQTDNVRAALLLVARGEAPLGIVYQSDAIAEPRVVAVAAIDPAFHGPIVYSIAPVLAAPHPAARAFSDWLFQPSAVELFEDIGFIHRQYWPQ